MDKVLFWDFDGTLVKSNIRFVNALSSTLKQFGYLIPKDSIVNHLCGIYPWLNYNVCYPNHTNEWWNRFLMNLIPFYKKNQINPLDFENINKAFRLYVTTVNDYVIYDDTKFVLEKCVQLGYKNFLLSNNFPELDVFVEDLGLLEYFSGLIISSHVGYEKPRKELFEYAKQLANCNSGIMIGDNPIADILGGKNNGLKTILVHNQSPSDADVTFDSLKEILTIL